jgi:hypothetical protein
VPEHHRARDGAGRRRPSKSPAHLDAVVDVIAELPVVTDIQTRIVRDIRDAAGQLSMSTA